MSRTVKTARAATARPERGAGAQAAYTVIERVIRARLAPDFVHSVTIGRGEDHDGDPIFEVVLVVKRPSDEHDRHRLLGLVRHIRSALAEIDVSDFPMVDVVSMEDAAETGLETA